MAKRKRKSPTKHPFQLCAEDFESLDEKPLIQVVNQLLRLEAVAAGLPLDGLKLTWKEKAPDGGVDARTEYQNGAEWIPSDLTLWQYKAGGLAPGRVANEFEGEKRAELRRMISEGADYVLVLGEDPGDTGRRAREGKLKCEMEKLGSKKVGRVVTAADLATRSARFLSLLVMPEFGRRLDGALPLPTWRKSPKHRHAFAPTDSQATLIAALREDLQGLHHGEGTYRVTGRSGIGKTRSVLEALDTDPIRPRVVYIQDVGELSSGLQNWLATTPDVQVVLVVDECDIKEHEKLCEALAAKAEGVYLATIGPADSPGPLRSGRLNIERASLDELDAILKKGFPDLSNETRRFICRLSSGYVRAAVILAEYYETGAVAPPGSIAEGEELGAFLEGLMGSSPSDDLRAALTGVSLFSALGVEGDLVAEVQQVAVLLGKTEGSVLAGCTQAVNKGLLETRGRLRFVSPEILAIRLAAGFWAGRQGDLVSFYEQIPAGKGRHRFIERLVSFGEDSRTQSVIEDLLRSKSVFSDVRDLGSKERAELLHSLATAVPPAGAAALERLLGTATVDELKKLNGGRRAVVWSLEKLVWLPETFETSARLLLALAEAENERYSNNATGIWKQIFRPYLSGTAVPGIDRLALLESILFDKQQSERRRELALEGLLTVFGSHASRGSVMDSLGGKPLPEEWQPRTVGDLRAVVSRGFEMLRRISEEPSAVGERAVTYFVNNFRGVLSSVGNPAVALMKAVMVKGSSELRAEGAKTIGGVLMYDSEALPSDVKAELEQIRDSALAGDLSARLRRWLGKPGPEDHALEFEEPLRFHQVARELADKLWQDHSQLSKEWSWLTSNEAQRSWHFFVRIGELDENREVTSRLERALNAETGELPPRLQWAAALEGHRRCGRSGWVWSRIEEAARDRSLAGSAMDALWRTDPSERAALLVATMIQDKTVSPAESELLMYGSWIGKTTKVGARAIADALVVEGSAEASRACLSLLVSRLNSTPQEVDELEPLLWETIERSGSSPNDPMVAFNWSRIARLLLDKDTVRVAAAAIAAFESEEYTSDADERAGILVDAARRAPKAVWSLIMGRYEADWRSQFQLQSSLAGRILDAVPDGVIMEWVRGRGVEGATHVMELTSAGPELSQLQRALLLEVPDSDEVRSALLGRVHSGGFFGSMSGWHETHLGWARSWAKDPEPVIRKWALSLVPDIEMEIEAARMREAEDEV